MSTHEGVLAALLALVEAAMAAEPLLSGATIARGEVLPTEIPVDGLVILRDGAPGEPEVTLSPLTWHYERRAEIEVFVQHGAERHLEMNRIATALGAALAADRTLGGACDWAEPMAPEVADLPVMGAEAIKAAVIPVILHYSTADPLA